MPNVAFDPVNVPDWPASLDDLRSEPGRIVFLSDLARLGIVRSYDAAKRLPAPLRLAGKQKAWEARTILLWIGAPVVLPADAGAQVLECAPTE